MASRKSEGATSRERSVVFVLPSLTMGGAEKQILTVLDGDPQALERYRVEVLTFLPATSEIIERRFAELGVPVVTIDRSHLSFPVFFYRLWRFFRIRKPSVVHTFLAGSTGTWGRIAARMAGVTKLMHSDRTLNPGITRLQRRLEPFLIPITSLFITNADAIAARLERGGVPATKIRVLRNAVATSNGVEVARPMRAGWGVTDDAVVVGFLGMFRPSKRLDLLFDAVLLLEEDSRPDLLVLAGDGELMAAVNQRILEDDWLSRHVRLLGVIEDTTAYLHSIDVMIMTSDTEGLPNAMLEAMAAEVPCVSTRVSDVPFLINDERFLADVGEAPSIAIALAKMLDLDPKERKDIGVLLGERVRAEFEQSSAAKRFWELHLDLWDSSRRNS